MNTEKIVTTLVQFVIADNAESRNKALHTLQKLSKDPFFGSSDPEIVLRGMLMELGTPDHLTGYEYLVKAILLTLEDRKWIDNLTCGLYPELARIFDTHPSRVERVIRHAIEVTWTRGDYEAINNYFGNTYSPEKSKATNGEFIARMANALRMRLKAT